MINYCKECAHTREHKIHDLSNVTNRYDSNVLEHPFSAKNDRNMYLTPHKRTLLLAKRINSIQEKM